MQALQSLHTFALPHHCRRIIEIDNAEQLRSLDFTEPFCVLGEGSNTIFITDFAGCVIKMSNKGILIDEMDTHWKVSLAAGENWHAVVTHLLDKGIAGLENLVLIPGTVGAAPIQNIGAYGVELAQFVDFVEGYHISQAKFERLSNTQCQFGYRDSIFKHALKNQFVITRVGLCLPKCWQPTLSYGPLQTLDPDKITARQVCDTVIAIRQSKLPDPHVLANSGSFFKNPIVANTQYRQLLACYPSMPAYPAGNDSHKLAAGWLIEQSGLKGYTVAGVRVYEKQALVLVNEGHSSGTVLCQVIQHIQKCVNDKFAVRLEHEVRLIGNDGEVTIVESNNE
ncbi:UDP-N-acetylmuramate dehydrogenase [Pseudoalteromonas sp. MMG013]|uniref:UDP-N-acetylmuramate dehydrogenase n=1 Tax=Pseudoalteromonas sp. MMG013 TaxID=2822687 RepID=UPI001B3621E1|nr:UDP-N-acetylmuramate dehydrogenase [Pseudoalteromonas sp. MMG013]